MSDTLDIVQMVARNARNHPDRLAIYSPDGQKISFARLDKAVRGIAHQLDGLAVGQGHVVHFLVDNPVVQLAGWMATMRLGARPILLGGNLPPDIGLSVDLVVALPDQTVLNARRADLDQSWLEPPDIDPPMRDGEGYFCASSGTTGTMKLIDRSGADFARQIETSITHLGRPQGPFLNCFSIFSTPLLSGMGRAFQCGYGIVMPTSSAAETLVRASEVGFACISAPPPAFEDFCDEVECGTVPKPKDVRLLHTIGASISLDLLARVERCFGNPLKNAYGSIETGVVAVGFPANDPKPEPGLVGPIVAGVEVSFRDDQGEVVPTGSEGRIHIRMDNGLAITSYVTQPVPLDDDGWFATGDLGRLRSDGQLILTGRVAELINAGGANRVPGFFESEILKLPGVARAAAFGLPGGGGYDILAFAVVPGDGFDSDQILADLHGHFAGLKDIRLFPMAALPLGRTGKIDRRALRAQVLADDNPA